MADNLETIRNIIEFHHTIRERVKAVGGSISDLEALFTLRGEYAGWSQSSLDKLVEQQSKLQEALIFLEDGLSRHFTYEEENLPGILGEVMTRGLLFEHDGIRKDIAAVKAEVFDTRLQGMQREDIALLKTRWQRVIDTLSRHVESHASREEIVLDMAREGLEKG